MPTYEYECKDCKHTFEAFQSMKDEPLSVCPECGGTVRRLLSGGAGLIFKGQGFYVTDKGKAKESASPAAASSADAAKPCASCPAAAAGAPCATAPHENAAGKHAS
jgi:putative FmdB family regulatory protein